MQIIITISNGTDSMRIQLDPKQKILAVAETLERLREIKGVKADFYRTQMKGEVISGYNTFDQEGIQSGEKLIALTEMAGK